MSRCATEIERDPMDRSALERTAASLSARVLDLEDTYRAAEAASEAADAALTSLIARRDELMAGLASVGSQLPAAMAEVTAAEATLADIAGQMNDHISGGA